ncbi:DUF72 domain-containing protein [soil metagenome]
MRVWIGTSGYSYQSWVGPFYPKGTRQPNMLSVYSETFPLAELNFTYYRLPTPEMLARQVERAPAGFQFLVKFPKTISHDEKDTELDAFHQAVSVMKASNSLLGVLLQMPQAAHQTKKRWRWLDFLFDRMADLPLAVEFRHHSWFEDSVNERLTRSKVDLVAVDVPDLPDLYPRAFVQTTPRVYIRLHSRKAENWYLSDQDRYDYFYSDDEMLGWARDLIAVEQQTRQAFVLFNNCHHAQAAANAKRFKELLSTLSTSVEIVEPFAHAAPKQRLLFE